MKVRITADVKEIRKDGMVPVRCQIEQENVRTKLLPEVFTAILKSMKDTNRSAFYAAMISFIDEEMSGEKHD